MFFDYSKCYDRLYYLKRLNKNAILIAAFYSRELSDALTASDDMSDAARNVLDEEGKLVGYEKLADDKREQNTDRLEILPPIFEKENIYDSFKTNADYYLYGKKSKEEVVDAIVESFYK